MKQFIPQPGDLLLYASAGRWYERLITCFTGGPWVHIECCTTASESVGALTKGITRHAIPGGFTCIPTGALIDAAHLSEALAYLDRKAGRCRYGWLSILADVPRALLPRVFGSRTPFLIAPRQFDCSQLAVDFCCHAGILGLPDEFYDSAATQSPNDVARHFSSIRSAV